MAWRWPWQQPKSEQRSITFQDLWGRGDDIPSMFGGSVDKALTFGPLFAATRLISDAVASLPLEAYRQAADGTRTNIKTPALLNDPTMFGGPYEWVQRCELSLLLRGNAYGFITSLDAQGFPRQVEWLNPEDVTVDDDRAIARPMFRWLGRPMRPWTGRDSAGELIHIPWYVLPGRIQGISPVKAFALTIEGGLYAQQFGKDFFKGSAIPSGVLETDQQIDQDQAQTIKDRFRQAAKGRDTVVLGAGAHYKPITVAPEDSQFLESIRADATTIAAIYGIYPAELIGGDTKDSMTYANVEQQGLNLASMTLRPHLTKLAQHFSLLLPRPQFARFNLDDLLRADRKTRYETHAIALDKKFKNVAEIREEEGLEPDEELEKQAEEADKPQIPQTTDPNVVPMPPRAVNE